MADYDPKRSLGARLARTLAEYTYGKKGIEHVDRNASTYSWAVPFIGAGTVATLGHLAATAFDKPENTKGGSGSSWTSWLLPIGLIGGGIYAWDRFVPDAIKNTAYMAVKNPGVFKALGSDATNAQKYNFARTFAQEHDITTEQALELLPQIQGSWQKGEYGKAFDQLRSVDKLPRSAQKGVLDKELLPEEEKFMNIYDPSANYSKDHKAHTKLFSDMREAQIDPVHALRIRGVLRDDMSPTDQIKALRNYFHSDFYKRPISDDEHRMFKSIEYLGGLSKKDRTELENGNPTALTNYSNATGNSPLWLQNNADRLRAIEKDPGHFNSANYKRPETTSADTQSILKDGFDELKKVLQPWKYDE